MKKITLTVLMALVFATPCFAQEVKPDGLFSFEGTRWSSCAIGLLAYEPFIIAECYRDSFFGLYEGKVYWCGSEDDCIVNPVGFYSEVLGVSIVNMPVSSGNSGVVGIMLPSGLGMYIDHYYIPVSPLEFYFVIGVMFKVGNNWTPPPWVQ